MRLSKWVSLALVGVVGCTDTRGEPLGSNCGPSPDTRWIYRTLLLDAGPLEGIGETSVGLPEVLRRQLRVGPLQVIEIIEALPERIAWTELGPGHFRFSESVQITTGTLVCTHGGRFEPATPCPTSVTLQHELLSPTDGFVPRPLSRPFEVLTAGDNAGYVADVERWTWVGEDETVRQELAAILDGLQDALGRPLGISDEPSRLTVHWLDDGRPHHWAARVHRALDPETGEIVAADVFIDADYVRRAKQALQVRMTREGSALGPRALRARTRFQAHVRHRSRPTPSALAVLRGRPVRDYEGTFGPLRRLAPAVLQLLGDGNAEVLFGGDAVWSASPPRPGFSALETLVDDPSVDEGWAQGQVYPTASGPPEWVGRLAFEDHEDASQALEIGLVRHLLLVGVLRALGLEPNFAASTDGLNLSLDFWRTGDPRLATSSVLDALAPEARPSATSLGLYDDAALRWLYRGQVAVFESPDTVSVAGLDVGDLPSSLCGDCGGAQAAQILAARSFVPESEAGPRRRVPFSACGAEEAIAGRNADCGMHDLGPNARTDVAGGWLRWSLGYHYDPSSRLDEMHRFIPRVMLGVGALRSAARSADYLRLGTGDPADQFTAAALGADLGRLMITAPRPGRYCPWPGVEPTLYLPSRYLNDCNPYLELEDEVARDQGQIEVTPGIARPLSIYYTEYDDFSWAPGSGIDKALAPWLLRLPARRDQASAALSDLFPDMIDGLFAAVAAHSALYLSIESMQALAPQWCPDEARPGQGMLWPSPFVADRNPACPSPSRVMPSTHIGDVRRALVALQLSDALERFEVYDMSEPEARRVGWQALPDGFCEVEDPFDNRTFRAVNARGLGCARIAHAQQALQYVMDHPNSFYGEFAVREFELLQMMVALRGLSR